MLISEKHRRNDWIVLLHYAILIDFQNMGIKMIFKVLRKSRLIAVRGKNADFAPSHSKYQ